MEDLNHHIRKAVAYSDIFARNQQERDHAAIGFQVVFRPAWRFFRCYFLRMGFLDGWQGYVVARMVAWETFLRYAKVREAGKTEMDAAKK
jgi:hypothetical protein